MKTKNFNFFLTIVLLLTCAVGFSQEYVTTGKCRLTINVIDKNNRRVEVTGLKNTGYSGDVVIPSCININGVKYTVTRIGDSAFAWCENLKSVTIPSSVTSIGVYAFGWCVSLTSIKIPNSVKSIGDYAFGACSNLTHIIIPKSVTSIGESFFCSDGPPGYQASCEKLCSIKVDPNNPVYDSRNNCNAIIETRTNTLVAGCKSTIIPSSVTKIGNSAFGGLQSLTCISIPNSVKSIGNSAFHSCYNLSSINIPSSVKHIGHSAFFECSSLTNLTIPYGVVSIGDGAFAWCDKLVNINIPNSVTSIGERAFSYCVALKTIRIPNSVVSIGEEAFAGSGLISVYIPRSVKSIGKNAFGVYEFNGGMESCKNLRSIKVDPNNPIYDSRNNCNAIIETRSNTLLQGCQSTVIPKTIKRIGNYAFWGIKNLTSITVPYSVTSIGDCVFNECDNLKTIILPRHIKNVNDIGLPEGVKIVWK